MTVHQKPSSSTASTRSESRARHERSRHGYRPCRQNFSNRHGRAAACRCVSASALNQITASSSADIISARHLWQKCTLGRGKSPEASKLSCTQAGGRMITLIAGVRRRRCCLAGGRAPLKHRRNRSNESSVAPPDFYRWTGVRAANLTGNGALSAARPVVIRPRRARILLRRRAGRRQRGQPQPRPRGVSDIDHRFALASVGIISAHSLAKKPYHANRYQYRAFCADPAGVIAPSNRRIAAPRAIKPDRRNVLIM